MRSGFLSRKEEGEFMSKKYLDCNVQVRCSSIDLANVLSWFINQRGPQQSMSGIIRGAIELLSEMAKKDDSVRTFDNPAEATVFLNQLNVNLRQGGRAQYSYMRAMQQFELQDQQKVDPFTLPDSECRLELRKRGWSEEDIDKGMEQFKASQGG